jgi:hypothetical protein
MLALPVDAAPKCFLIEEIDKVLPLGEAGKIPDSLRGIWWMDENGVYGPSTFKGYSPVLGFSWGASSWDKESRTVTTVMTNGWSFQNNLKGYQFFGINSDMKANVVYQGNDDFSSFNYSSPPSTVTGRGDKVIHKPGACPPKADATKQERAKCADFAVSIPELDRSFYYFRIVDGAGNKIQPYFDAFVAWAKTTVHYNPGGAQAKGITDQECAEPGTAFVGFAVATGSHVEMPELMV